MSRHGWPPSCEALSWFLELVASLSPCEKVARPDYWIRNSYSPFDLVCSCTLSSATSFEQGVLCARSLTYNESQRHVKDTNRLTAVPVQCRRPLLRQVLTTLSVDGRDSLGPSLAMPENGAQTTTQWNQLANSIWIDCAHRSQDIND